MEGQSSWRRKTPVSRLEREESGSDLSAFESDGVNMNDNQVPEPDGVNMNDNQVPEPNGQENRSDASDTSVGSALQTMTELLAVLAGGINMHPQRTLTPVLLETIPVFSDSQGKDCVSLADFLARFESVADANQLSPQDRVRWGKTVLTGRALEFVSKHSGSDITYDDFRSLLDNEFGPKESVASARERLRRCAQLPSESAKCFL